MSSNLLKGNMLGAGMGESRIIDTNALIAERLSAIMQEMREPAGEGFTEGLHVEEVDISELLADDAGAQEEAEAGIDPEEAQRQAQEILQDAKSAAERILQDAIAEAEQQREETRRRAYEEGYQEGAQKAESELRSREAQLEARQRELEAEYDGLIAVLEPKFVDTLTGIYEHLFHVELGGYRDILLHLIGDCLRGAEGSREFQIRVSAEDYSYVSTKKARLLEAAGAGDIQMEIVEDPNLDRNDCIIRTETGILDCGLGTQLDELTRKLKLLAYEKK